MADDPYTFEGTDVVKSYLDQMKSGHLNRLMKFLGGHASQSPTTSIPGSLKELKGDWKGYWQYDVSMDIKLIYRVDEESRTVYVDYLGPHPEWKRSADRQNL